MAIGKGTINLLIHKMYTISISNIYFVSGLAKNLFSVSKGTSNGVVVKFHNKHAIIYHKLPTREVIKTICPNLGRLYPFQTMDNTVIEANKVSTYPEADPMLLSHH
jgi:hypothetical protein